MSDFVKSLLLSAFAAAMAILVVVVSVLFGAVASGCWPTHEGWVVFLRCPPPWVN